MDVVDGIGQLNEAAGPVFVVVGVFDGLHRGHLYLLRRLVAEATGRGVRPTVLTFDAHPDEILVGAAPPLLLDPAERLVRLAGAGVEVTIVQHFDRVLRETPYDRFVGMIRDRVELAGFLMTPDAAFGFERRGTPKALAALGRSEAGRFEVVVVPPFVVDGAPVRSSDIRAAIAEGDLERARGLLGRSHAVVGNVDPASETETRFRLPVALPPAGDYAARVGRVLGADRRAPARLGVVTVHSSVVHLGGRRPGPVRIAFVGAAVGG
ncbi:MAG: hypothetical protein ACJ77N_10985 [Chloroflexota bacterium]